MNNIPSQFTLEVRNRFSQLLQISEAEQTPNELWENMKEVVQTAAKKHIPKKRKKKQPWITKRTLNLADERRSAKAEGVRGRITKSLLRGSAMNLSPAQVIQRGCFKP